MNWSEVTLNWENFEIVLTSVVKASLIDKYRVRSMMENNTILSYIMLLTGVTWQAPH